MKSNGVIALTGLLGLSACADVLGLDGYGSGTTTSTGGAGGQTTSSSGGQTVTGGGGTGGQTITGGGGTGGQTTTGGGGTGGTTTSSSAPECDPGTMEACYTGPPDTLGVGPCKAGQHTCSPQGMWGPCSDVPPAIEDCATTVVDENCDNLAKCTGDYRWAKRFGDAANQRPASLAADASGDAIVVGGASGTLDFMDGAPAGGGGEDVFVVKLGPDGKTLWSKRWGDAADQEALSVAVDKAGNIVVAGMVSGSLDAGGQVLQSAGGTDMLIVSLAPDGQHRWSKLIGGASNESATAVAVDPSGDVIIGGVYSGPLDAGGGALPASLDSADLCLIKLDGASGAHVWSQGFPAAGAQKFSKILAAPSGDVVAYGDGAAALSFGGPALVPFGGTDIFVARFGSAGQHLWSNVIGSPVDDIAVGAAIAEDGSAVFSATSLGGLKIGATQLNNQGGTDAFVWNMTSAGGFGWKLQAANPQGQYAGGVMIDGAGNVLVSVLFQGTISLGTPITAVGPGLDHAFVKLTSNASHIWSRRYPGGNDAVPSMGADPLGNILFATILTSTANFGGGPLVSAAAGVPDVEIGSFKP